MSQPAAMFPPRVVYTEEQRKQAKKEAQRRYYQKNKEKLIEYQREYDRTHPKSDQARARLEKDRANSALAQPEARSQPITA